MRVHVFLDGPTEQFCFRHPTWHKHIGKVEVCVIESAEEPNKCAEANDVGHDG